MADEAKTGQVNIRMELSLKAAAERAASDDQRPLSSFIKKVLADHLKKHGYLKPAKR
jgi:hypothetical protein